MTLKDVALKANCSVATVSKALKNSSEISEDAKQRILAVAKESGYLKKATTRSAVLGGLKTVIFNDISGENANLYFEIQKLAKKYGLITIYISVSEKDSLELLNQLGAFGLILFVVYLHFKDKSPKEEKRINAHTSVGIFLKKVANPRTTLAIPL